MDRDQCRPPDPLTPDPNLRGRSMDFIPNTDQDRAEMLRAIGVDSVEQLLEVVPEKVRRPRLDLPSALTEMELAEEMRALAEQNLDALHNACFLGAGVYNRYVPSAISQMLLRSEFYTSYTPYQPEVSQGVLQATFEFQSMICALTGMEVTNASMYDGATCAGRGRIDVHGLHEALQGSGFGQRASGVQSRPRKLHAEPWIAPW